MELRQLRYLLTVAEEGHFTRAAEKLYVSQPALSQQIKQLEEGIGSVLIDRSARQVRLTPAGEVLCHYASRVFQELDEARVALEELDDLRRGSLTVGVVQTVNAYLIPRVVARFVAAYPAVRLTIEERPADEIENGVQDGVFQVGIGFVPPGNPEIEARPLFDEDLILIAAHHHALAARREIAVRELDGLPMALLSTAFCTRRLWDNCARQVGIAPQIALEMNTIANILDVVRHTDMVTVLPAFALNGQAGLAGIRLCEPTPRRTVGLLRRRNGYRCAATHAFEQIVHEILQVDTVR